MGQAIFTLITLEKEMQNNEIPLVIVFFLIFLDIQVSQLIPD